ncbi:MAG: ATP-dependent DNA helicase RecQ [Bacteroidales bacterium]|nr:RecQ family ATP-dependent DNA helicase [Bacteroidales bacterium]MBS3774830.1 RecQ family ATP-dependent DNA helicase [Bacteroidales bacterium]
MELYKQILLKYWGYSEFRPLQEDIVRSVVEDRKDTLALMPTGGGKSITFQVPSLAQEGICLVITPLIALMKDQVEKLRSLGIKAMAIHSGMKKQEIDVALDNCIFGNYKFLYISPERIETEIFKARVQKMNVNLVTVDEAHCISQWGYDFRPSYLKIVKLREYLSVNAPFLALTATATPDVIEDIQKRLDFGTRNVLWKSFERKNLVYLVREVENKQKYLLKTLSKLRRRSGIIYTRSRKRTREIAELLQKNNISADYYHAGLEHDERARKQEDWQEGRNLVMVSTNAFGMGIDKPDVRFVIHYDVPDNIESYFQEAGRAGRDGKRAYAVLLYNDTDRVKAEQRIKNNFPEISQIKAVYEALGNYFQIPIEGGKNQAFDFNVSDFASTYHFSYVTIYNSLDFLQKEGYIELTDELSNRSKIHFWVNRDNLYNFQLSRAEYDTFIKLLLRSYTGVFTDYVNIDERYLARRANSRVEVVYRYLQQLKKFKILDYIPYKKSPMVVYTEERLDKRNIHISREKYRERKSLYISKLHQMIHYASNTTKCRSRLLLEYFGEMDAYRCGQCDVCASRNELELNDIEFNAIFNEIKDHLQHENLTSEQLVDRIDHPEDKVIKVIDWLLDNKNLLTTDHGELKWAGKRNQAGKS